MNNKSRRQQSGVALIFSLLVSLLLGVFAAFFTFKAQRNIALAEQMSDQFEARLIADGDMNKAIYALSSVGFAEIVWSDETRLKTNFWGDFQPVSESVSVSYQDLSARLNLIPFKVREWNRVLQEYGLSDIEAQAVTDKIQDWMDSDSFRRLQGLEARGYRLADPELYPRDQLMQSKDELLYIPGLTPEVISKLDNEMSYWGGSDRSPLLGSKAMILAYSNLETYLAVMDQRTTSGNLRQAYRLLEDVDVSRVNSVVSGMFRIVIQAKKGEAKFTRVAEVNMRGTDTMPFYVIGWQ